MDGTNFCVKLLKNRNWSRLPYQIGQIFSLNIDFTAHTSTFRAGNIFTSVHFKGKNNAVTTSEQPQNNFQKVQKNDFFGPKMVKMTPSEGQFVTKNFDFRDQVSTFRAKFTTKSKDFKAKNNA